MVHRLIQASQCFTALLAIVILSSTGCTLCSTSGDLAYPAYGGAWQRTIRDSGRVGSVFDPAGARASTLVSRDQPETADELERGRREAEALMNPDDPLPTPELDLDDDEPTPNIDDTTPSPDETDPSDDPRLEGFGEEDDPELERKKEELRNEELDVKVIPGKPLPPMLR